MLLDIKVEKVNQLRAICSQLSHTEKHCPCLHIVTGRGSDESIWLSTVIPGLRGGSLDWLQKRREQVQTRPGWALGQWADINTVAPNFSTCKQGQQGLAAGKRVKFHKTWQTGKAITDEHDQVSINWPLNLTWFYISSDQNGRNFRHVTHLFLGSN